MNNEWLLEKNDQGKLQLLMYVESFIEQAVPIWQVQDELKLSHFLVKKRVEEINRDIQALELEDEVTFFEQEGFLRFHSQGGANSQVFADAYVEKSLLYQLLTELVQQRFLSIQEFADAHFVSYAKIYQLMNALKSQLRQQGIFIQKNYQLTGTAKTLQSVLFQVYRHRSIAFLPALEEQQLRKKLERMLTLNDLHASPRQVEELRIYYALRQLFGFAAFDFSEDVRQFLTRCVKQLKGQELLEPQIIPEIAFYFYTELQWFADQKLVVPTSVELSVRQLLADVQQEFQLTAGPLFDQLYAAFSRVHMKYMFFPIIERELYSRQDMLYFEQVYTRPFTFLQRSLRFETTPKAYQSYLFYQDLLVLIRLLPEEKRTAKVKVFVDFTLGAEYNAFIKANLRTIENFSLQIVDTYGPETEVILTNVRNFYREETQDVLIWMEPPTPKDWENFGNRLKRRQVLNQNV